MALRGFFDLNQPWLEAVLHQGRGEGAALQRFRRPRKHSGMLLVRYSQPKRRTHSVCAFVAPLLEGFLRSFEQLAIGTLLAGLSVVLAAPWLGGDIALALALAARRVTPSHVRRPDPTPTSVLVHGGLGYLGGLL